MSDQNITAAEIGRRGGKATLEKHGAEHFKNLTKKRFEGMTREQISDYMKEVSRSRFKSTEE